MLITSPFASGEPSSQDIPACREHETVSTSRTDPAPSIRLLQPCAPRRTEQQPSGGRRHDLGTHVRRQVAAMTAQSADSVSQNRTFCTRRAIHRRGGSQRTESAGRLKPGRQSHSVTNIGRRQRTYSRRSAVAAAWPQEQPQLSRDDHDRPRLVHLPGMPGHDALYQTARAKQSRGWPAQVRSCTGISRNRYGPPGGRVSETRLAG